MCGYAQIQPEIALHPTSLYYPQQGNEEDSRTTDWLPPSVHRSELFHLSTF